MYTATWKPIFTLMEECPGLNLPDKVSEITTEIIEQSFERATEYLKTRVSYIWLKEKRNDLENWTISTWSRHVSYGYILKYGTEEDKSNLPPPSSKCGPKKRNRVEEQEEVPVQPTHPHPVPVPASTRTNGRTGDIEDSNRNEGTERIQVRNRNNSNFASIFNVQQTYMERALLTDNIDEQEVSAAADLERLRTSSDPSFIVHQPRGGDHLPNATTTTVAAFGSLIEAAVSGENSENGDNDENCDTTDGKE
jgi:hypothetical protein